MSYRAAGGFRCDVRGKNDKNSAHFSLFGRAVLQKKKEMLILEKKPALYKIFRKVRN